MARLFLILAFLASIITTIASPLPCPAAEPVADIEKLRAQGMSERDIETTLLLSHRTPTPSPSILHTLASLIRSPTRRDAEGEVSPSSLTLYTRDAKPEPLKQNEAAAAANAAKEAQLRELVKGVFNGVLAGKKVTKETGYEGMDLAGLVRKPRGEHRW